MAESINLTADQRKVIGHSQGRLRVIACPGSGKTETIARRIASLIGSGEDPRGISAITFTEKAAGELKIRIRRILDAEFPRRADFGDMFIGTIHALCLEMLREADPVYRTYDILDGPRRVAFLAKGSNYYSKIGLIRLQKAYEMSFYQTVRAFLHSADIMITERIDPRKLTDNRFAEVFLNYLNTLQDERYFDFPTIIRTLVEKIENEPDTLEVISPRIQHVLVDEFQDVDHLQGRLIDLLSGKAASVAVVGDDDQGIYHWRGTDVSIMMDFGPPVRNDCTDVTLGRNFRSTAAIVDLATGFITHNTRRIGKTAESNPMLTRKYEEGDIQAQAFSTREDEMEFISSRIKDLAGTDFLDRSNRNFSLSYSDMAVLTRTNEEASKVIEFLDREGIPSVASSGESIFVRPEVGFALDCMAWVFRTDRRDGRNTYTPDEQYLRALYSAVFSHNRFPEASPERFFTGLSEIRADIDELMKREKKNGDYLKGLGLQEIYHRILQSMGSDIFDFGDVYSYNLAALSQAVSDYESVWVRMRASEVKYFFNFISAYGDSSYQDPSHEDRGIIDAVRVMTIHKAKGLEFPVVFVPDFVKHRRPREQKSFVDSSLYDHERYRGDEDDERRVYYTAVTRSEKYLFLTGSRGSGKDPSALHPFLDEMPSGYISPGIPLMRKKSGYPPRLRVTGEYETSYSELISYIRCPQDFRLRNVYGFNAGVPPGFGYGTSIHNALNMIHRDYIRHGKIPDETEVREITGRLFHLRYATSAMKENMLRSAERVVQNYVRMHSKDFSRILETEKRFEFLLGNSLINGQIDLIRKSDSDGGIRSVEIIDFKSEKQDGTYSADYERQLRYYAIACLESLDVKPERAFVHHLDAESPSEQYTEVDISEPRLAESKDEIKRIVTSITSGEFPPKPSEKRCSDCDYVRLCPYKVMARD